MLRQFPRTVVFRLVLLPMVWAVAALPALAQNVTVSLGTPTIVAGRLRVPVQLRSTSGTFSLGPTNIVLQVNSTCLDAAGASVVSTGADFVVAPYAPGGVSVGGTANRVNIALNEVLGSGSGTQLTATAKDFATVDIPILDCGCPAGDRTIQLSPLTQATELGSGNTIPIASFATVSYTLGASITSGPSTVDRCATSTANYTADVSVTWSIISAVGSTVTPGPSTSATVTFGPVVSPTTDTLVASASGCVTRFPISLTGTPNVSYSLLPDDGQTSRCQSGTPFTIVQSGSQAGVTYRLRRNGSVVSTQAGTGSALNWTGIVINTVTTTTFVLEAESSPSCTALAPSGLVINTADCTLPTPLLSPTSLAAPVCEGTTRTLTASYASAAGPGIIQYMIWSANSAAVSFPNGNSGLSVEVSFNAPATNVIITATEYRSDGSQGTASLSPFNISASPTPSISGPSTVFRASGSVNANFTITNATSVSIAPSGGVAQSGTLPNITYTFTSNNTYTITATNTVGGCTKIVTRRVRVDNCNVNPGTIGPDQTSCLGEPAVVYVLDEPAGGLRGTLRWQTSPNGTTGWTDVPLDEGVGATSQVHITRPLTVPTYYRLRASRTGPSCDLSTQPMLVTPAARSVPGVVLPIDTSVCVQGVVELTSSGGTYSSIRWEQSSDGVTWAPALGNGTNTTNFQSIRINSNTYFRARYATGCDVSYTSVLVRADNNPRVDTAYVPSGNTTLCLDFAAGVTQSDVIVARPVAGTGTGSFLVLLGGGSVVPLGGDQYRYQAVASDTAESRIQIAYVVQSGSCLADIRYVEFVVANRPDVVIQPLAGIDQTVCRGATTANLIVNYPPQFTGRWLAKVANDTTSADAPGVFIPDNRAQQVRFTTAETGANSSVFFFFVVDAGTCGSFPSAAQQVSISGGPVRGSFPPLPSSSVCYVQGDTLGPIRATFGLSGESGEMTVSGGSGQLVPTGGGLESGEQVRRYRYEFSPSDVGQTITFTWTITQAGCAPRILTRQLVVAQAPLAQVFISGAPSTQRVLEKCNFNYAFVNGVAQNGTGQWVAAPVGPGFANPGPADNFNFFPVTWGPYIFNPDLLIIGPNLPPNQQYKFYYQVSNASSTCPVAVDSVIVRPAVSPSGTFGQVFAPICAGQSSPPLGASITSGAFSIGTWSTDNGSGTFSNVNDPNAVYYSDVADGLLPFGAILRWTVTSPGCFGSASYVDTIPVVASAVSGSFPQQRPDGSLEPVCWGERSLALNATATAPTTGQWETNGAGTFVNATGTPVPVTQGDAFYQPARADVGNTIEIRWRLQAPAGVCNDALIVRQLTVRDTITPFFPPITEICFERGSDTLRATIEGDPGAVGTWTTAPSSTGYTGQGFFTLPNSGDARYVPSVSDIGRRVRLVWTARNGVCADSSVFREALVLGSATINVTNVSGALPCAGDTVTIVATGAERFNWDLDSRILYRSFLGDTIIVATEPLREFLTLGYRAETGVCSFERTFRDTMSLGLEVRIVSTPPSSPTNQVCASSPVQLNVGLNSGIDPLVPGGPVQWFIVQNNLQVAIPPEQITDPNIRNPIIFPTQTTIYGIRALTTNGCFGFDTIRIEVRDSDAPIIPLIGGSLIRRVCRRTADGSGDTLFINPVYPNPQPGDQFGWYLGRRVDVIAQGNPPPANNTVTPLLSTSANLASTVGLPGVVTGLNYVTLYYRNAANSCQTYTEIPFIIQPSPEAEFELGLPVYNEFDQIVGVNYIPSDTTVRVPFHRRTFYFRSNNTEESLLYDFGDPQSGLQNFSESPDTLHTYTQEGIYTVVLNVVDSLGCVDLQVRSRLIEVLPEDYDFPNAFTPNNNNLNEIFRPLPTRYDATLGRNVVLADLRRLQIFDRWGALVWENLYGGGSDAPLVPDGTEGWDGRTPDGKEFEPGTYTYKAFIRLANGTLRTYTGFITLIR